MLLNRGMVMHILPVLLGGFLAILGSVTAQVLLHMLEKNREKETLKRARIETFVKSLYEYNQYVQEYVDVEVFDNSKLEKLNPLNEAQMLSVLYFPQFNKSISELFEYHASCIEFVGNNKLERISNPKGWAAKFDPARWNGIYKKIINKIHSITIECRNLLE